MTDLLKFVGQVSAALAICWFVIKLVLDQYFKVSDELQKEKKRTIEDNIKRIESSNIDVKTSVVALKTVIVELQTRVLRSQIKSENIDEKLKEISERLERVSNETRDSIKEVEKTLLIQLGNDLVLIKSIAQKLRGIK